MTQDSDLGLAIDWFGTRRSMVQILPALVYATLSERRLLRRFVDQFKAQTETLRPLLAERNIFFEL